MKRASVLLALLVLIVWLAHGAPAGIRNKSGKEASVRDSVAATRDTVSTTGCDGSQSCCVNQGETDPHWECLDGACYCVSGCGSNVDCATCGCNPDDRWACINNGGYWDDYTCTCDYSCDPDGSQQAYCTSIGGTWDAATCSCQPAPCNPGPEQMTWQSGETDCSYCESYDWQDCTCWTEEYTRYCQDGTTVYSTRYEAKRFCYSADEYCDPGGGGGGGGGGGSCWDTGECYCDYDYGYCCEYDYCWLMEE